MTRKQPPTDLQILQAIYDRYYDEFISYQKGGSQRRTKNYVPIDIASISASLDTDPDIVFGRLHYHLNQKYSIIDKSDNSRAPFFDAFEVDRHSVQFPLLASVLASLHDERSRFMKTVYLATASFVISIIAAVISGLKLFI